MLPRMVSYPIDPITVSVLRVAGAVVRRGQRVGTTFADDYQAVPVILIAQQFSLAVFPSLSAAHADGDGRAFRSILVPEPRAIGVADDRRGDRCSRSSPRRSIGLLLGAARSTPRTSR